MSTPAESRWIAATREDPHPDGTWWALYRHPCAGCFEGIFCGDLIEYARDRDGNVPVPGAGIVYRHARPTCRGRWRVRREERPYIDGAHVPLPAVWVVREPGGRAVFVTDSARGARLIADARAHGRPDPYLDED